MNDDCTARDTVDDWLGLIDEHWPSAWAADWDQVGLQVGAPSWPVARVLVTLDVTPAVISEAAQVPATLVVAHHPLLFRPVARLTPDTAAGAIALQAARAGVAVAAAHTNLDVATDGCGTTDPVVQGLGLVDVVPLTTQAGQDLVKLVTFVPHEHRVAVIDAVTATGAGTIGDYTRCTFTVEGAGTFTPGDSADPHIGDRGVDETVAESRVELQVPSGSVQQAVAAVQAAHPYEEVPIDLYPLLTPPRPSLGRRGRLPHPTPLREVARTLADELDTPHLRAAGDPDKVVSTIAAVGGAGESMIDAALGAGVDCFVTGDLKHHVVLDAVTQGLAVIDAGHHAVEHAAMRPWRARLAAHGSQRGLNAPVVASSVDTQPWMQL